MSSGDRYVVRRGVPGTLATSARIDSTKPVTNPFYEGIVVDAIVDHTHPQYAKKDGYNVGCIKARIFSIHNSLDEELLDWVDPIDSTMQEIPLIGELVVIEKVLGSFFYRRKTFLAHRITENGMLNLNRAMNNRPDEIKNKVITSNQEISLDRHEFGEYFRPDSRVRQLKHFEGDVIWQGRKGNSIRLGSSQMDITSTGLAPNVVIRTGQAKGIETSNATKQSPFGLIIEDVNNDVSSIWMTSEQIVPFEPNTIDAGSFYRSLVNPIQKFDGGQIILNSERIVLNSKKTHIMLFSHEEIYLNSFKRTSIDTSDTIFMTAQLDISHRASRNVDFVVDQNVVINAGKDMITSIMGRISTNGEKTYLGSIDDDKEPQVGGTTLSKFLARLILTLIGNPTYKGDPPTSATSGIATQAHTLLNGMPCKLNPVIERGLKSLFDELKPENSGQEKFPSDFAGAPFNSVSNFIKLANDPRDIVPNNFKVGTQVIREKNPWNLADKYYKVY